MLSNWKSESHLLMDNSIDVQSAIIPWLLATAIPGQPLDTSLLPQIEQASLSLLLEYAYFHRTQPNLILALEKIDLNPDCQNLVIEAKNAYRLELVTMARLRQFSRDILQNCTTEQVVIVKGPAIADDIYPKASLRRFTDIDFLVDRESEAKLMDAILETGFEPVDPSSVSRGVLEHQFLHSYFPNLLVETHTEMVGSALFARRFSLEFEDIVAERGKPSLHLMVALIDGYIGDHYRTVGRMVDVVLSARALASGEDEQRFVDMVEKGANRMVVCNGLQVAGRILDDGRCLDIAKQLSSARWAGLSQSLVELQMVDGTIDKSPGHNVLRRLFKLLLLCTPVNKSKKA